jgi:hypothetical protein
MLKTINPFNTENAIDPVKKIYSYIENEKHGYKIKQISTGIIYIDYVIVPINKDESDFVETSEIYVDPTEELDEESSLDITI